MSLNTFFWGPESDFIGPQGFLLVFPDVKVIFLMGWKSHPKDLGPFEWSKKAGR